MSSTASQLLQEMDQWSWTTTIATRKTAMFEPKDSHLMKATSTSPTNNNNNNNNHPKFIRASLSPQQPQLPSVDQAQVITNSSRYQTCGLSNPSTHSYYDCCINVHVSSLLDHWLDWEPCPSSAKLPEHSCCANTNNCYLVNANGPSSPAAGSDTDSMSTSESSDFDSDEESLPPPLMVLTPPESVNKISIEFILSHLCNSVDPVGRLRQFSASIGCDINRKFDDEGKSLIHHIFAGKIMINVLDCGQHLLDLGADPNARDVNGETPLLSVRHLMDQDRFNEAYEAVCLLTAFGADVNVRDRKEDQSLLSWAVGHGDKSFKIVRHLLNSGADVWNLPRKEAILVDNSAFKSYLKALMANTTTLESSSWTLTLICTAMVADRHRMVRHVDRCMMELGVAPKIYGPLFKRLRSRMAPYLKQPQSLKALTLTTIRKSILQSPPKRLQPQRNHLQLSHQRAKLSKKQLSSITASSVCQLSLPQKLRRYVCLGEKSPCQP